jgi:heme/copper-type cytochrome/quinol oxidase subunit 2
MNNYRWIKRMVMFALALAVSMGPRTLLACAVCYGASDAAQTRGMNYGIATMLGVTGVVLGGVGGMFFYFVRRARYSADLTP